MYWINILTLALALSGFSLFPVNLALPSSPTNNLIAAHRYANLSSPVSGQVLYAGRPFRIRYHNQICTANATQVSLFNSSGLFLIASNISFSDHKTDTHLLLPSWVSNGTYDFVFRENDSGGLGAYQDVVLMTIYVGNRPPPGIYSGEIQDTTTPPHSVQEQPFSQVQPCYHQLISREPHPPRFDQPADGSTFSPGSTIAILYRDGETTSDRVQFVLKSLYTGHHYILGNFSFNFFAKFKFRLSNSTPEGPYQIFARENSPDSKNNFTNVLSVNIHVAKPHSPVKKDASFPNSRDRARRSNHNSIKITESPTILLPPPAEVVSLGSTIQCMIHDSLATTETVKFVLRSQQGQDHHLGQATFTDHLAGGHFDLPAQIPTGTYSVMVRQNSVARPYRFLNVVSTTVFITYKDRIQHQPSKSPVEAIQLSQPQTTAASELSLTGLNFDKPLEQAAASDQTLNKLSQSINHQLVRREPHFPHFQSPLAKQAIPAGSQFLCQFIDGQVTYEKVRFVLRHPQQKTQVVFKKTQVLATLAEARFKSSLASSTCSMPTNLTPGLYEIVAQENTLSEPEAYSDIASVDITVESSVVHSQHARSTRALIRLATREPHPVMFRSPVEHQNIVAGELFQCHLTDGETTATLVKFSLKDSSGNETILGQTSFSRFQAQGMFRCPEDLAPGSYALVAQENSSSDGEHFEESSQVQVNVVAKGSTMPPASAPSAANSTSKVNDPAFTSSTASFNQSSSVPSSGNSKNMSINEPISINNQQVNNDPNNGNTNTTTIPKSRSSSFGNSNSDHNNSSSVFTPTSSSTTSNSNSIGFSFIFSFSFLFVHMYLIFT